MRYFLKKFRCHCVLCVLCAMGLVSCGLPPVKGLPTLGQLQHTPLIVQQQVEVKWREQSFSFLLYQQQFPNHLQMLALTVSGQILFELSYDGHQLSVVQRDPALKHLPLHYLFRDILWANLSYSALQHNLQPLGLQVQHHQNGAEDRIRIQRQQKIEYAIVVQDTQRRLDNYLVPYQLLLTDSKDNFFQEQ